METAGKTRRLLRFGQFEADVFEGKLYRRGRHVHVQDKPFQIMLILADRPRQLITREDFRNKLWSADTFVEFDEGLNAAIGKLRSAIGDSAERPFFIETVRGRGYRWIGPADWVEEDPGNSITHPTSPLPSIKRVKQSAPFKISVLISLGITVILILAFLQPKVRRQRLEGLTIKQLTTSSAEAPVRTGAISPDGKSLAFSDLAGLHVKNIETGETRAVPMPEGFATRRVDWQIMAWFPDGKSFLANIAPFEDVCLTASISAHGSFQGRKESPRNFAMTPTQNQSRPMVP